MEIYHNIEEVSTSDVILTIGTFDGVHSAHRVILDRIVEQAQKAGKQSMLITFSPHPRTFVSGSGQKAIELITSDRQKVDELKATGLDILLIQKFDRAFSELSAEDFIEQYMYNHLKPSSIIIGYDHKFGKDRKGDIDLLNAYAGKLNYKVQEISKVELHEVGVSSSQIRSFLSDGKIQEANQLLGRPYSIRGTVIKGQQNGRKLGYPTANIKPDNPDKLIPRDGVYYVRVDMDGQTYKGALNIGNRPSVDSALRHTIEVYILDFEKDIYGRELEVEFIDFIRPEIKFANLDELKTQISRDVEKIRTL